LLEGDDIRPEVIEEFCDCAAMEFAARHEFGGGDIGTPFAPGHLLAKAAGHLDEKIADLHFPPGTAVGSDDDMACFPSRIPQHFVDGVYP
jgi:hypothetical protein